MKIILRYALWLVLPLCGSAYAEFLKVEPRTMIWVASKHPDIPPSPQTYSWENGGIRMPFISSVDIDVAGRINDALYLTLLETPAPIKPGKTFQLPKGVAPLAIGSIGFKVLRNDDKVLTLEVKTEACGSYCEDYFEVLNFDVSTGRALGARDILTSQGMKSVASSIELERKRRYAKQINILKKELEALRKKTQATENSEVRGLANAIAFMEDCRENNHNDEPNQNSATMNSESGPGRFYKLALVRDGILFEFGHCGNRASRGLDTVEDAKVNIKNSDLEPSLTAYGKMLLLNHAKTATPSSPYGQVLHGKIGNSPIVMRVDSPFGDNSLAGVYYYIKYRKMISLSGTKKDSTIKLIEYIEDQEKARFTLSRQGAGFVGHWEGNNKQLPVTVE